MVLIVTVLASPAMADAELVYLEPDSDNRYLPRVSSGGMQSTLADIDSYTPPTISPDGTRVAFTGALGDESLGLYAIFVVDINGSNLEQLTGGSFGEVDPSWSPDGDALVAIQNTSGALYGAGSVVLVDASNGDLTDLTGPVGAQRPEYSPDGTRVLFDKANGIFRVPAAGGASTQIVNVGYDASFSPDGARIAYIYDGGLTREIRTVSIFGGPHTTVYSTSRQIEAPEWHGDRIRFTQFLGLGYDGRKAVQLVSVRDSGGDVRAEFSFSGRAIGVAVAPNNDEIFFYRSDGLFRFYDIDREANLGSAINEGTGFSSGWTTITSIDLDGDGTDEMLFYRSTDGTFKYYETKPNGGLGALIAGGIGYSTGWSSITAVDLEGDGQDEIMFYRSIDGAFRYYQIGSNGALGSRLQSGSGYSTGWSTITAVDLEGDGSDEMLFYRATDGTHKYYDMKTTGALGALILGGTGYSTGWSSITSIDLDGDSVDEILFYRASSGSYRYYDIQPNASLGATIRSGTDYEADWSSIIGIDLD